MVKLDCHFDKHTTAQEVADAFPDTIVGKYIVVTGVGPGGLGNETARAIATKQPRILVLAGRDWIKLEQSRKGILESTPGVDIRLIEIDLGSLASIQRAAKAIISIGEVDILINNAGVIRCPYKKTEDGFEYQFGVNYIAPFVLSKLLLPSMLRTPSPRIVNVSSAGHLMSDIRWDDLGFENGDVYDASTAYGQSKTALLLHSVELAERYGPKLISISLHPGGICTPLQRHYTDDHFEMARKNHGAYNEDNTPNWDSGLWKTVEEGASTTMVAAFDPRISGINGSYLTDCQLAPDLATEGNPTTMVASYGKDPASAKRLWELTEKLVTNRGSSIGVGEE